MVRALRRLRGEADFEWRGGDVSRLEALTDGVFALALTLLIVSLEVPNSFDDLIIAFQQIPAFAASFAILISFWVSHYFFHRRYGLEDGPTIALNAVLMFLILLYVYPLRFLATLLMEMFFNVGGTGEAAITAEQWPTLMLVYSGGYAAIYVVFTLMTSHALRHRETLGLNPVELEIARGERRSHLLSLGVAMASVGIVLINRNWFPYSGMIYMLMGPLQALLGTHTRRRVARA